MMGGGVPGYPPQHSQQQQPPSHMHGYGSDAVGGGLPPARGMGLYGVGMGAPRGVPGAMPMGGSYGVPPTGSHGQHTQHTQGGYNMGFPPMQ